MALHLSQRESGKRLRAVIDEASRKRNAVARFLRRILSFPRYRMRRNRPWRWSSEHFARALSTKSTKTRTVSHLPSQSTRSRICQSLLVKDMSRRSRKRWNSVRSRMPLSRRHAISSMRRSCLMQMLSGNKFGLCSGMPWSPNCKGTDFYRLATVAYTSMVQN